MLQGRERLVAVLDVIQLFAQFSTLGYQFFDGLYVVFLFEVVQFVQAIRDGIHFHRIKVDALQMAAHFLCNVLQFDIATVYTLHEFCGHGVDIADLPQFIECGTQGRDDAGLFGPKGIVGFIERPLDILRMAHGVAALFQLFLFSLNEVRLCQFVALESQEVGVLTVALDTLLEVFERLLHLLVLSERLLVLGQFLLIVREDIDHTQLEVLLVEQEVLML